MLEPIAQCGSQTTINMISGAECMNFTKLRRIYCSQPEDCLEYDFNKNIFLIVLTLKMFAIIV